MDFPQVITKGVMRRTQWKKDQKGQEAGIFPFTKAADTEGSLRLVREKGEL